MPSTGSWEEMMTEDAARILEDELAKLKAQEQEAMDNMAKWWAGRRYQAMRDLQLITGERKENDRS